MYANFPSFFQTMNITLFGLEILGDMKRTESSSLIFIANLNYDILNKENPRR